MVQSCSVMGCGFGRPSARAVRKDLQRWRDRRSRNATRSLRPRGGCCRLRRFIRRGSIHRPREWINLVRFLSSARRGRRRAGATKAAGAYAHHRAARGLIATLRFFIERLQRCIGLGVKGLLLRRFTVRSDLLGRCRGQGSGLPGRETDHQSRHQSGIEHTKLQHGILANRGRRWNNWRRRALQPARQPRQTFGMAKDSSDG